MKKRKFCVIILIAGVIILGGFFNNPQSVEDESKLLSYGAENAGTESRAPEKISYVMRLYLDIHTLTVYGRTTIQTTNTIDKPLQELWFTLYPNAFRDSGSTPAPPEAYYEGFNPGWCEVDRLLVNGKPAGIYNDGMSLKTVVSPEINPGDKINIEMDWRTKIPKASFRFGYKDNVYMLGNFYPRLNYFNNEGWYNSYNAKFGDPFCFNCADYTVELNIPEAYAIASTGNDENRIALDNGRQIYNIKAQNARDFCLTVFYDYIEMQEKKSYTSIKCYAPKDKSDAGQAMLNETGQILDYYNQLLGVYPFQDFKVVFVPLKGFDGMEYTQLVMINDCFLGQNASREQGEFVLAHEIAHQWWYGLIGNDQLKAPWLDEGLANWCAYKYMKDIKNCSTSIELFNSGIKLNRQLKELNNREEYYRMAYSGGEAFWAGLEQELGTSEVVSILHSYITDYRFKIASTRDILDIIRKQATKDVEPYLSKWFGN